MPILPLNSLNPFAAIMGVMHYPGSEEQEQAKSLSALIAAKSVEAFVKQGGNISPEELLRLAADRSVQIQDLEDRQWKGWVAGQLVKTLLGLKFTDERYATWENAIILVQELGGTKVKGTRSTYKPALKQFSSVAHLWAAWYIRDCQWYQDEALGYDAVTDVHMWVAESEHIRRWATTWSHSREKSKPPLSGEFWTPPIDWTPPTRQPGWPRTGGIPHYEFGSEKMGTFKLAGRQNNSS